METNLGTQKITGERNIGIDLLRLGATFMIVILHVLRGSVSANSTLFALAETFLLCCYNLIALIAGYVFCTGKFRLGRVIRLWVMVIFYSVVFYLITAAVNSNFAWNLFIKSFFPVVTWRFWYFSSYVLVLLLMPLFNYAIEKLNRKAYLAGLIFFAVFFSAIQFAADPWGIADGKSALWLAYLYFIGAYCKKYGFPIKKWWANLLIYLCSSAASFGLLLLSGKITISFWEQRYAEYFHQYCCIFALIGAVALFAFFAQLPIKRSAERTIRYFSAHAFGIYLSHSFLISYFLRLLNHPQWTPIVKMLFILIFAVAVFLASFIVEAVRRLLFKVSRIDALTEGIGDRIQSKLEKE